MVQMKPMQSRAGPWGDGCLHGQFCIPFGGAAGSFFLGIGTGFFSSGTGFLGASGTLKITLLKRCQMLQSPSETLKIIVEHKASLRA